MHVKGSVFQLLAKDNVLVRLSSKISLVYNICDVRSFFRIAPASILQKYFDNVANCPSYHMTTAATLSHACVFNKLWTAPEISHQAVIRQNICCLICVNQTVSTVSQTRHTPFHSWHLSFAVANLVWGSSLSYLRATCTCTCSG